jgi:O-antigen ligase
MLAMALPIALVSALHASRWRDRILYGLAICILLSAAFATYRKSALLAPFSVIVTVAYFRRRELLRLAPLALVLLVLIHILAPGALGKTTTQFDPGALAVTTVSDRAADYDAVRPDMWSHLLFGRGWGSYDHFTYRILDSELLHRLLEMGVFGLLAFVGMVLSVLLSARTTIAERDPTWAPFALIGAAAAVSFLMVSTLFDVLAFPHATYIFLYMAGLTAVVIGRDRTPGLLPVLDRFHGGRERSPTVASERQRGDAAHRGQERVRRS